MRILANPTLLRAMIVLICGAGAFVMSLVFMRLLRQQISEEGELGEKAPKSMDGLPMYVYNTVIQQLKQQKQELLQQLQAEQQRAKQNEIFHQAVWLNVSSGVLIFGSNGLAKAFNPAAKMVLGFASLNGMSAENIFRGAVARTPELNNPSGAVAEEVNAVLHKGSLRCHYEADYETPAGEQRVLAITILPVHGSDASLLGIVCFIDNLSQHQGVSANNITKQALESVVSAGIEAATAEAAAGL